MGLDITAYRQLTPDPTAKLDEDGSPADYDEVILLYDNPNFPGRSDGVTVDTPYRFAESHRFRAGSYGGYNDWRDALAKLAGYPAVVEVGYRQRATHAAGAWAANEGPFWELINFADNEGTIGPVVAAKLLADFKAWDERAKAFGETTGDSWFYDRYQEWTKAFEMAADGGAVSFH